MQHHILQGDLKVIQNGSAVLCCCLPFTLWQASRAVESSWNTGHSDPPAFAHGELTDQKIWNSRTWWSVSMLLVSLYSGRPAAETPLKNEEFKEAKADFLFSCACHVFVFSTEADANKSPVPETTHRVASSLLTQTSLFITRVSSRVCRTRWCFPVLLWRQWTHVVWELTDTSRRPVERLLLAQPRIDPVKQRETWCLMFV